jgi:SAM-dependent methyltransferase
MEYQEMNAKTIDRWIEDGWTWGIPISHEAYLQALEGKWSVLLTPARPVPREWFGDLKGRKVLGLASGGGQQMPIFAAAGAECTVLDYSEKQLESERVTADREGYGIEIIRADMTKELPFEDESFDLIFHPVSNCYVEEVKPIFKECYRILKDGGILLSGLDNGVNFIVSDDEKTIQNTLPFNPLKNKEQMRQLTDEDCGVQFSHTLEEQIGGQLEAGFVLTHLMEDTNESGYLKEHNIPCFLATRAVKRKNRR